MELDSRKQKILKAIIEEYTRTGEPVGSKRISALLDIVASPATIRNDMAILFEMGLLEQPHTSAGRVPSHVGYRYYIDHLMQPSPISPNEIAAMQAMFNVWDPDPDKLLADAAQALADYTHCAAISSTSTPPQVCVRRIELIPAGERTVIIMVIASNGAVKSKVCRVNFSVNQEICNFFTSFANARLAQRSLNEISSSYINSVAYSFGDYSEVFTTLLSAIYSLCKEINDGQFCAKGVTNLLGYEELRDYSRDLLVMLGHRADPTGQLRSDGVGGEGKQQHGAFQLDGGGGAVQHRCLPMRNIGIDWTGADGISKADPAYAVLCQDAQRTAQRGDERAAGRITQPNQSQIEMIRKGEWVVPEKKKQQAQAEQEQEKEQTSAGPSASEQENQTQQQESKEQQLQTQLDELNDRLLRTMAEYDNYRKRSIKEKDAIYPQAKADTVEKFLPIIDNFERAMQAECADEAFKKGMEMIFQSFMKTMTDLSVEEIGKVGEQFNPDLHNAVMHIEDESLGENVVAQVLQKGYRIGERVVRYAMVQVAN